MNAILQAKIETCLQLSANAQDFKGKVKKVTGLTNQGFERLGLCADAYDMLVEGKSPAEVLRALCP